MNAMQAIHIEHVLLSLRPGGLENGVVNVVNRMDRGRFQSSVCCLKEAGAFASRIEAPGVQVHEMGLRGGNDLALPLRLAAHFRNTRPDIVHTRNPEAFFYGWLGARLAGVPFVVHSEHGRTFCDRRIRLLAQRWMSRFTSQVFSVSEQLRADLTRHVGIPHSQMQVIQNGVDLARFGVRDQRSEVRDEFGMGANDFVICSVGRLAEVKNYAFLLRCVAAAGLSSCRVVLIGDGPEKSALASLAESLGIGGQVHLPGHRDDVSQLLCAFDVFVLPSLSEGMSNTLLEAMACGMPPIVSDVGGNREIVQDGVNGLVFASGDEATLIRHLRGLFMDASRRASLGQAALRRVAENFSIDAMIDRYERLYERVAQGGRPCR